MIGVVGLVTTVVFGLRGTDVPRHISYGIFSTMVTLLAHSMMMFYLIGKGKAVKDALKEHSITGDYYQRIGAARKPVFSIGMLAMAVTMVAAIMGASVDTGVLPPMVHAMIAYGAVAANVAAAENRNLRPHHLQPRRRRSEPTRRLVTPLALAIAGLTKDYRGLRPLRIQQLTVGHDDTVAILGFDQASAEVFVNLVTGATLPDAGTVHVFGHATSAIADGDEWLQTLDRFGIVTERAVLLDQLTVVQNLAMPFTLDIEPPPDDVRARAGGIAQEVGLQAGVLGGTCRRARRCRSRARTARPRAGRRPGAADPRTCERAVWPRQRRSSLGTDIRRIAATRRYRPRRRHGRRSVRACRGGPRVDARARERPADGTAARLVRSGSG